MKCIFSINVFFSDGFFFSLCTLWGLNQCDKNKGALRYQEEATTKARPIGDPLIVLQCYAKGSTCLLRWEMARHFLPRLLLGPGVYTQMQVKLRLGLDLESSWAPSWRQQGPGQRQVWTETASVSDEDGVMLAQGRSEYFFKPQKRCGKKFRSPRTTPKIG